MSLPEFTEETILTLANGASYAKGMGYARRGAVQTLFLERENYRAQVQGYHLYSVRLWDQEGAVKSSCTCPYEWGGICKHVVAVMVRLLDMQASGQEAVVVNTPVKNSANSRISLNDLLESTTHDQLKAFIRQQTFEIPQLVGNLRVFAQGAKPTDNTAEDYNLEIAAALTATRIKFMNSFEYDDYYVESPFAYGDDDQEFLREELAPFRKLAEKYQAQQNWIECAKIQEAIVHACGRAFLDSLNPQQEIEDYYWHGEIFSDGCQMQACNTLMEWAILIPQIKNGQDKLSLIERFVALFVSDSYEFGSWYWEEAFKLAFESQSDAEAAIRLVDAFPQENEDPLPAGVLLHLLGLTDDTDRFLQVAHTALPQFPHLALPLVNKLVAIGERQSAIQVAEEAVAHLTLPEVHFGQRAPREDLLRFLIETLDPERENRQLRLHAGTLFFESAALHDYRFLRDLMPTQSERQQLLQQVQVKCSPETVTEIFKYEECWDQLLAYAQQHVQNLPDCPQLLHSLHDRFPASCFELYQELVVDYLNRGTGQHLYDRIALFVRQMQALPGQGSSVGNLMVWIYDNFQRRINLMKALDEFIAIGFELHNRQVQEAYKNLTLEKAKALKLPELAGYCPLARTAVRQSHKEHQAAALIWAALLQHDGSMEAGQISNVIAREMDISPTSANTIRGKGLSRLESHSHVEVVRELNRICQVNLLTGPNT